jgi:hypothetical protein
LNPKGFDRRLFCCFEIYSRKAPIMAMDKALKRIEAKLDALLTRSGMTEKEIGEIVDSRMVNMLDRVAEPRKLTPAEQQAIDNAPKPTPVVGPGRGPRVTATNAPDTSSSVPRVPADAVGSVTVETQQPDGDVTVQTMDADAAKGNKPGGKPGKSERVNWNS